MSGQSNFTLSEVLLILGFVATIITTILSARKNQQATINMERRNENRLTRLETQLRTEISYIKLFLGLQNRFNDMPPKQHMEGDENG